MSKTDFLKSTKGSAGGRISEREERPPPKSATEQNKTILIIVTEISFFVGRVFRCIEDCKEIFSGLRNYFPLRIPSNILPPL